MSPFHLIPKYRCPPPVHYAVTLETFPHKKDGKGGVRGKTRNTDHVGSATSIQWEVDMGMDTADSGKENFELRTWN